MAKYRISVNLEFVRSADLDFRAGIKVAAKLGYKYVEPMVHTGWELLSEVGYFHSFSMEEEARSDIFTPFRWRKILC
jgi:hypothetical protein